MFKLNSTEVQDLVELLDKLNTIHLAQNCLDAEQHFVLTYLLGKLGESQSRSQWNRSELSQAV